MPLVIFFYLLLKFSQFLTHPGHCRLNLGFQLLPAGDGARGAFFEAAGFSLFRTVRYFFLPFLLPVFC